MDAWDKIIEELENNARYAQIAVDNAKKARDLYRKKNAEISIRPIKEGKIECERGGMYNERPHVQLQPGDNGTMPLEQPEARKRDKYQGK